MITQEFILEIGAEEIPAGYLAPAVKELSETLLKELENARIAYGKAETFATPRRLGLIVASVAEKGEDQEQELMGPPARIAFDNEGNPRVPAQKFAEKVGLPVEQLERKETAKGEYLIARVIDKGVDTQEFLSSLIPTLLTKLSFPKKMRWATEKVAFARPVHWICALFGGDVLPFSFAGVQTGNQSRGHRFLSPREFEVADSSQFKVACREGSVILDPSERRKTIWEDGKKLAESCSGQLLEDEELLELNTYLSEYPKPILASFAKEYLALPPELIRTSIKTHLKSFVIVDENGKLLPYFMPVAGLQSKNEKVVVNGFQRVLKARLADAQFFYDEDRKKSLESIVPKLDEVIFQTKLGSFGEKVQRLITSTKDVTSALGMDEAVGVDAKRAATLCKADLLTGMVYEFPELQGIMGRYYAQHDGEGDAVANAIFEHYLPAGQDDPVAESKAGQVLAIVDRLDSLTGGFAVGMRPSGSADPYALRRQAIGIIRTLKEKKLPGSLRSLLEASVKTLQDKIENEDALMQELLVFLKDRLKQILLKDGWPRDLVDAVCVIDLVSEQPLSRLEALLGTLQASVQSGQLAGLAYSFKRVNNILRAAAKKKLIAPYRGLGALFAHEGAPEVQTSLLEEGVETALFEMYEKVRSSVEDALTEGSFSKALDSLMELHSPIDDLFDHVMVMADDEALRDNRLALLRGIARLAFLDFSRINTESEEKKK